MTLFQTLQRALCLGALTAAAVPALWAQSMRRLFVDMPASVEPLIERNDRLDLVDFIDSHMEARVDNALDGHTRLLRLTPTYCVLQSSPAVRKEFLLLPMSGGDSIVLGLITYASPARQSVARFYGLDWQPLARAPRVEWPVAADFWLTADTCNATALADARRLLGTPYVCATVHPDSLRLECALSLANLAPADSAAVAPYLRPAIVLQWRDGAFRRVAGE